MFYNFKSCWFLLFLIIVSSEQLYGLQEEQSDHWLKNTISTVPNLPDSLGLSGTFIGTTEGILIVAGGSNFEKPIWEGGEKKYYDSIYALLNENGEYVWQHAGELPHPIAHGAVVETSRGLILIGGENQDQKFNSVLRLEWDEINQKIIISDDLPTLPQPVSYTSAAILENSIFVTGGKIDQNSREIVADIFWKYDYSRGDDWEEIQAWPGVERFGASLVKQSNGEYDSLYLFSGKSDTSYLRDAFQFDPRKKEGNRWTRLADLPRPALLAPSIAIGGSQIFLFSGSDGHDVDRIMDIANDYHFVKDVLSYNTITDSWYQVGEMPAGLVGSRALLFGGEIIIPGGEVRPSVRTSEIYTASLNRASKGHLSNLDYIAFFSYLCLIIGLGIYFSSKNKTSNDYYLGGQNIPFWAAGLSLMATQVSAIGFMAIPAKSFATNWSYFSGVFTWFIAVPIVIYFFVPFYRRLNVVSVYEYLEERFNLFIRSFIALLYLLFQLVGRLGAIIYLPSIALAAVTDLSVVTCVVLIGVLATVYTVLGGMYAVIWTDVIQSVVLFGGVLLCILFVIFNIEGGTTEFVDVAFNDHKFSLGSMDFSLTMAVFWVIVFGNIFNRISLLSSDQSMVQRYMTTRDEKETKRALWASVWASIPWAIFVFGLGTALYVFYKANPGLMDPMLATDQVVPYFISQNLPVGASGIIIAGIFAAAMSSVDSSIHSSTTVIMRDFLYRKVNSLSETKKVKFARSITTVLGVIGTGIAVSMSFFDIVSVWDFILEIMGLFAGGMTGIFVLGIFSTKANGKGATVGILSSAVITLFVQNFTPLHFFLYSFIGILSTVVIGYIASLAFKDVKDIEGLTIFTLNRNTIDKKA